MNIGREVVSCATEGSVTDVFKCFGNKLLEVVPRLFTTPQSSKLAPDDVIGAQVPPLNFLNRVGDMIQAMLPSLSRL